MTDTTRLKLSNEYVEFHGKRAKLSHECTAPQALVYDLYETDSDTTISNWKREQVYELGVKVSDPICCQTVSYSYKHEHDTKKIPFQLANKGSKGTIHVNHV